MSVYRSIQVAPSFLKGCSELPRIARLRLQSWLSLVPGTLLFFSWLVEPGRGEVAGTHNLSIRHPGKPVAVACELLEQRDANGVISGYSMEVESVTCADKKCDVVPVRLHWDDLGNYVRYELDPGGELTKKGHEVFTRDDYRMLGRILADPDSPLRWVGADELVPPEKAVLGGADVVSGATALSRKGTVVKGAAYTCYTLWHWVNGELREQIRRVTAAAMGKERALGFLGGEDQAYVEFALEQLAERKIAGREVIEAVSRQVESGDDTLARKALRCLERQAPDDYFRAIERLFLPSDRKRRVMFLQSMGASRLKPPAGFAERVSRWIPKLESYREVDLLLRWIEAQGGASGEVMNRVVGLLDDGNFLVARRAYWFLEERDLTDLQKRRLEAFRGKHGDRL